MKKLQRFLAAVLCACVITGMMTHTAFAVSETGAASPSMFAVTRLTIIRLTIDAPGGKGKTPATTASLPSTARSVVEKVEWSGQLDIDGTFMPRVKYKVTVTLGIKPGSNCIFSDRSINATVNGNKADEVLWYANDKVTVSYTFPAYGTGSTLTSNWITMDGPAVGERPAATAHLASTASTYVSSIRWEGALDSNGCFQAGTEYTAYLTLRVKDEFKDRKFSTKSFDAYVNGVLIDEVTRISDKELIIPVEFERLPGAAPAAARVLEEAYLTIAAPEAGKTAVNAAEVRSTDGCYVKDVKWIGALDNGRFQSGVEYTAIITLGIPSGSNVKFSDTVFDAVVNGVVIDAATLTRVSDMELIVPVEFVKTAAGLTGGTIPAAGTAYANTQMVEIDGKKVEFQMYALKDDHGETNYIKVRDLALALNGTAAQFGVDWNGAVNLTSGSAYIPNGSENKTPFTGDRSYTVPTASTNVNGAASDLVAIYLEDDAGGGYTYYQLRDLGRKMGFNVDWTAERGIFVETNKPYTGK